MKKHLLSRNDRSKLLVMKDVIIVKVGTSTELADIVAGLMKKHRPDNCTPRDSGDMWGGYIRERAAIFTSLSENYGGYDSEDYLLSGSLADKATVIDAATEMGKLIELLEALKEIEILNVAYDGQRNHSGIISPDGQTVKVGCSTVTYEKVKEVFEKMSELRK